VVDLVAWLKWPEFHRLESELRHRLDGHGRPVLETAFADFSEVDGEPSGSVGIGMTADRVMVVRALGSFVRRAGDTLIDSRINDVEITWEPRLKGWRRVLTVVAPGRTVRATFAPLWYPEAKVLYLTTGSPGGAARA